MALLAEPCLVICGVWAVCKMVDLVKVYEVVSRKSAINRQRAELAYRIVNHLPSGYPSKKEVGSGTECNLIA